MILSLGDKKEYYHHFSQIDKQRLFTSHVHMTREYIKILDHKSIPLKVSCFFLTCSGSHFGVFEYFNKVPLAPKAEAIRKL